MTEPLSLLTDPSADPLFAALADGTRRRVLARVAEAPVDAGSVASALGISRQAVAKHLRLLEEAGLVQAQTAARRRVHRVDPARLREVADLLAQVASGWDRRLADLAARAEQDGSGTTRHPAP